MHLDILHGTQVQGNSPCTETGPLFANSATDRHSDFLETLQEGIELTDPASLQRHPTDL